MPQHTQERILQAARELNYRPSFYARNLGVKRTYTIGVVMRRLGTSTAPPSSAALNGIFGRRTTFFLQLLSATIPSCWKPIRAFYWIAVWKDSLPWTL